MLKKKINWGIIGLGHIAHKFAHDLLLSENAILHGVASRNLEKSKKFATKFKSKVYYNSYEDLVKNHEIDIIYIATPHVFHFQNTMLCLLNNKAVLCEKPFAINSDEVNTMIREAKNKNLFLMEAMWTRFIPGIQKVLDVIKSGDIGTVERIEANFGYVANIVPTGRLFNPELGGGSLMDIGIYPIYLSLLLLGIPTNIEANANIINQVDYSCDIKFTYQNGQIANLKSTLIEETLTDAVIYGTGGKIKIHTRFHHPKIITISNNSGYEKALNIDYKGNGYYHEIEEANNCLLNNKSNSEKMPGSISIELIETLDRIRKIIGLSYPNDTKLH